MRMGCDEPKGSRLLDDKDIRFMALQSSRIVTEIHESAMTGEAIRLKISVVSLREV